MSQDLNPMIWPVTARRVNGEMSIGNIRVSDLADEFGTPSFVLDEADFQARAGSWAKALQEAFGPNAGTAYYAAKSFISTQIARWIDEAGLGLDVCTDGELAVAIAVNFPAKKIELHGNNKSESEIASAIDYRVGVIVIDSLQEIDRVARIAHEKSIIQGVLLRLNPGVDADTHEAISTGHEDVKFGFSIASGAAWDAVLSVKKHESLELKGLHAHIGSQIFTPAAFELSASRLISILAKYRDEFGVELAELDLGGGYAIAYLDSDRPSSAEEVLSVVAKRVKAECEKALLRLPRVSIEPGRVIVGPSMVTIYEVGTTKEVSLADGSDRWYVSVDGGMSDNIRPALYGAEYSIALANRSSSAPVRNSRVVGKHCETGDIIIREVQLPSDIVPGDLLVVPATGAYGRSMASNYNHMVRPPVICVLNGKARSIIRRETHRDLLALEIEEEPRNIGKGGSR
ncbi:MAG: diaminopimelate decarboxylase [Actinobacteria bacterium]|nr:diaminopimelate decarboxylase [Actinomycetota bacterium]